MRKESDMDSRRDQVAFYRNGVDPEEEITRPRWYPAFVQWLIQSKLEAALRLYAPGLRPGLTVLVICCGSGLDLEFLATQDLTALGLDLSLDAVRRANERGDRFGVYYHVVCGDATV
jgi:cyclopropane fatty-acyl-phospholipid synthase-like methyltransferase